MEKLKIIGAIIFIFSLLLFVIGLPRWTADTVTFTVTDKERIVTGFGGSISSKYLVFTESETLQNSDCWVLRKFGSSDLQGRIKEGETYTASVYGWRVPLLSWYRNIVEVELQKSR